MTRVDFYILSGEAPEQRLEVACRLIEKAFKQGHNIFVHCPDTTMAHTFDQQLWHFRDSAFIPHGPEGEDICIGAQPDVAQHDLMINLAPTIPNFFGRFHRVLEIVCQHPEWRDKGRENFRFYRDRGYPLSHHQIN